MTTEVNVLVEAALAEYDKTRSRGVEVHREVVARIADELYSALRAAQAEITRLTAEPSEAEVEAAIKAWWAVPLPGVRGMQGVAMRAALSAAARVRAEGKDRITNHEIGGQDA